MRTILTVDDCKPMREVLARTLQSAGFQVVQADNGIVGLAMLDRALPDAIITDLNMPELDGWRFIEAIRGLTRFDRTPIMVLSSESDSERRAAALRAGANAWLVKPISVRTLLGALERLTVAKAR